MWIIPLYSYSNTHNCTITENRDLSHWNAVHFEELQRCWLTIRAVETACSHRHSDTHEPGTDAPHWFYSGLCQHIAMRSLHNVSRDHSLGSWMILDATVNAKLCQVMPSYAKLCHVVQNAHGVPVQVVGQIVASYLASTEPSVCQSPQRHLETLPSLSLAVKIPLWAATSVVGDRQSPSLLEVQSFVLYLEFWNTLRIKCI